MSCGTFMCQRTFFVVRAGGALPKSGASSVRPTLDLFGLGSALPTSGAAYRAFKTQRGNARPMAAGAPRTACVREHDWGFGLRLRLGVLRAAPCSNEDVAWQYQYLPRVTSLYCSRILQYSSTANGWYRYSSSVLRYSWSTSCLHHKLRSSSCRGARDGAP